MAANKKGPMVSVYLQCRFCQQVENLPLVEIRANVETGQLTTVTDMRGLISHMERKHTRKLEQLAEESEQESGEAEVQAPLVDGSPGRVGEPGVQQDGLLSEMGPGEVPAAFRLPG